MSSPSSSSRQIDRSKGRLERLDSKSRLERAKYQYENLLLHAGSNLLIDEQTSSSSAKDRNPLLSSRLPEPNLGESKGVPAAHQPQDFQNNFADDSFLLPVPPPSNNEEFHYDTSEQIKNLQ
jgi:hypothetical protein